MLPIDAEPRGRPDLTRFNIMDHLRRTQGRIIGAMGFDPAECPYRVSRSESYWRLRGYADHSCSTPLLIVSAPIKRPYIWDLAPSVSAVRYIQRCGLHVYLLEWMPASLETGNNGLEEYARAISECVAMVSDGTPSGRPVLMGHSLGGTLASIYAALAPQSIRTLVLLSAPLCFQPEGSRFRDALVSLLPRVPSAVDPFPGSVLSQASALASPGTFVWSRLMDALLSVTDLEAMDIHARVERWALDEVPVSGKLVHQVVESLYRANRLCRGTLELNGILLGPGRLSVPTLAVVNAADELAPLASVEPFTSAMPTRDVKIIGCPGELGVGLQHLGILIGRVARRHIWPQIMSWCDAHVCASCSGHAPSRPAPAARTKSSTSANVVAKTWRPHRARGGGGGGGGG